MLHSVNTQSAGGRVIRCKTNHYTCSITTTKDTKITRILIIQLFCFVRFVVFVVADAARNDLFEKTNDALKKRFP